MLVVALVSVLSPWLHCFSLQSRITKADREKHQWSSEGNTKVKKKDGKVEVSGGPSLKATNLPNQVL